jgi:hypothetical protein
MILSKVEMNNEYHEAYKFPGIRCGRCLNDGCLLGCCTVWEALLVPAIRT